jgi:hypothetical protein
VEGGEMTQTLYAHLNKIKFLKRGFLFNQKNRKSGTSLKIWPQADESKCLHGLSDIQRKLLRSMLVFLSVPNSIAVLG